jgi:D-beta-D-heptose 7-phosphate kinase/D-beta-D-heptose 1-phosphate adenosyltransferase
MTKIKNLAEIKKIVQRLQIQGKSIVFTNGCFDLLHPGHIKILREAKKKGDVLLVGLNSDDSIRRLKGNTRPILDETARALILSAISYVDYIVLFKEDTPYKLIKEIRPDYLIKGQDWDKDKVIGREFAKKVVCIKFYPGYSTTAIIKKIKSV